MGLLELATDPNQYDRDESGWASEGIGPASPTRAHFWEYLEPFTQRWKGKTLLDIGSGTNWLADLALQQGVEIAIGIEPSVRNVDLSQKLHPDILVIYSTLEEFKLHYQFDIITSLMSLNHLADMNLAFGKISSLLNGTGEFFAIVGDYDHQRQPRRNYKIELEDLNPDEFVVSITRPFGTLVDIIRRISVYENAARNSGLELVEDIPMVPTLTLMERIPGFRQSKDVPMTHLLRFTH